jgi:hypothetical protein
MSGALEQVTVRRANMADLMARAIPQRDPGAASGPTGAPGDPSIVRVATESGWTVPPDVQATQASLRPVGPNGGPTPGPGPITGPVAVPTPYTSSGPVAGPSTNRFNAPTPYVESAAAPLFETTGPTGRTTGPVAALGANSGPTTAPPPADSQAQTGIALDTVAPVGDLVVPPTRRRTVPPTRVNNVDVPPTRMLPLRGLPVTRNQLAIGGGVVVLLIIIVVAAKSGGGAASHATSAGASAQSHADAVLADPVAPVLARASDLYANGDVEAALDVVTKARRQHPESAQLAYLGGKIYFAKLWWTDGVKAFREAIRLDPGYRSDPELIKVVVRGFITTPDTDARIEELLREDLGDAARSALEETAKDHPNAAIRSRAAAELRRLH